LARALVEADHRALLVVGLLVEVQDLLHPPDEPGARFGRDHPALEEVGTKFVFLSVFLTVSWETLSTMPIPAAFQSTKTPPVRFRALIDGVGVERLELAGA